MNRWDYTKLLVEFKGALIAQDLEENLSDYLLYLIFSDDLIEKELEIKLDITKKSRRINRRVQFADQHGKMARLFCVNRILFLCTQATSWRR